MEYLAKIVFAITNMFLDIYALIPFRRSAQAMGFSENWLTQVLKNKCKYVKKIMI